MYLGKCEMNIYYQKNLENITSSQLSNFCVGWKHPISGTEMYEILNNSYRFVLALDGDKVVGFVNSLSDGLKFAFIPMLEVLPNYKNHGIGSMLLNNLFDELEHIQNIDLTCDEDLQRFYDKFGMLKSKGMVFRKYLSKEEIEWYKNNM